MTSAAHDAAVYQQTLTAAMIYNQQAYLMHEASAGPLSLIGRPMGIMHARESVVADNYIVRIITAYAFALDLSDPIGGTSVTEYMIGAERGCMSIKCSSVDVKIRFSHWPWCAVGAAKP